MIKAESTPRIVRLGHDTCPDCGADRVQLREMLKERPIITRSLIHEETENHVLARIILDNCRSCRRQMWAEGWL